jgi:hypothetical protein
MFRATAEVIQLTPGDIKRQEEGKKILGKGWEWFTNSGDIAETVRNLEQKMRAGEIVDWSGDKVPPYGTNGKPLNEDGSSGMKAFYIKKRPTHRFAISLRIPLGRKKS